MHNQTISEHWDGYKNTGKNNLETENLTRKKNL